MQIGPTYKNGAGETQLNSADMPGPLLSIITIAFQCRHDLGATIASVSEQVDAEFEYVVVDGGSSDGSLDLIAAAARVDQWTSKKDRGIYDAMNKGVTMAGGQYICFMNAGDRFADSTSAKAMIAHLRQDRPDVLYGDAVVEYSDGSERLWRAESPERLPYGMIASHQATCVRRRDLLRLPFRLGRSASDFEFLLRLWHEGKRFVYADAVLARVSAGGLSDVKRGLSVSQRWQIIRDLGLDTTALRVFYLRAYLNAVTSSRLHRMLSPKLVRLLRSLRWRVRGSALR